MFMVEFCTLLFQLQMCFAEDLRILREDVGPGHKWFECMLLTFGSTNHTS